MPALDPQRSLHLLLDELKRLRKEGLESVYLSDASRAWLDTLQRGAGAPADASPESAPAKRQRQPHAKLSEVVDAPAVPPTAKKAAAPVAAHPKPELPEPPVVDLPAGTPAEQWARLRERVLECETCRSQVKPGKQVVFGVGDVNADLFFCGEAPGADEEVQGEPFVGPAGQLLTKIIQAMGLSRESVYIGNIMNWRPDTGTGYGNRPPTNEELRFCLPYLQAQVDIVKPKVIVGLGGTAARGLLGLEQNPRMGDLRGQWREYAGIPLMVTYHPSYLLRNQTMARKREVWEDMLLVMEKLGLPISEMQRGYFR